MKNNSITRSLCLCAAALGLSLSTSQAANVLKSDTASMLTNAVNWATVPATTDIGEFNNIPQPGHLAAMALGGTMTLRGLVFDNNMNGPLVIGTAASTYLTNGVAGIDMSQANQSVTFNNLMALGQAQTWKVAAGQSNIVNGVVSGPGFLTLGSATTPGTVYFGSQANVYPGGTLINGGTVVINATGSLGSGAVTNNGGILVLSHGGISPFVNSIVISNTTSVIDDSYFAGNDNMIGNWAGGGTVTISNMATYQTTFTFGGNNSASTMNNFSGKIIVAPVTGTNGPAEGTLRFNSGNTSFNVGSTAMSVDLGPYPSAVTLMQRNGAAGPTGQIFNVGELKGGTSTSVIGSRQSNSTITYSIGGANTSTTYAGTMTNSFGGNTATTSINKALYGGGVLGLQKVGSGTLTLTGTNYYTGNTTFSGGVLNAGAGEATAATQNPNFVWAAPTWYGGPFGEPTNLTQSQFIFNGGTLQYSSVNNADYSGRFSTAASQAISIDVNGQNVTFATALVSTSGSLTNHDTAGGGSLTLTAAETYSGNTTIASGTLALSGSGALPATTVLNIKTNGTFDVSALTSPSLGTISLIANGMGTPATTSTIKAPAGGVDIGSQTVTLLWSGALVGTDSTHPPLTVSGGPLNLSGNTMDIVVSGTPQQFLSPGVYTLITTPATITGSVNATPSFVGGNGLGFAESALVSISGNSVILTVSQLPIITWTDANSDQLWSTGGNWLSGTAPHVAGDLANFGKAVNTAISLNQNASIGGALFTNANSYTITATGANALTADNSGAGAEIEVTTGGTANNIAAPINLNDNLATVVFANQSLKLSGIIANTAGPKTLTIGGEGTNILTQANTYGPAAGLVGTIVNSGTTLQVGNNSSLGAGDVSVVNGGGTLQSGAAGLALANNIGITNTTLTANNNGNTFTLGGVISGSGGLVASGSGIVSLSGVDTFTGASAISNGVLQISGAGQWGGASGNGTNGAKIVNNGTLDYASSAAQLLTGNISGTGGITVDSGTLALQGQNTFTGNILVNGGTLSVQTVENVNVPAVGSLGNVQTPGQTATINTGGILSLDANGGNEFGSGSSSCLINFIINGGTMQITNNNAMVGPVTFMGTGGVMDQINSASTGAQYAGFELDAGVSVGGTGTSTMQSTVGGYYNLTVNSTLPYGIIYVTNSAAVLNITAKLANSGQSQGVAGLLKDGQGTLNLSAANAYTGDTIVSNGTLALVSGGTINTSPHIIVLPGGTMDFNGGTLASAQTLSGTGTNDTLAANAGTISPGAVPGGTGAAGTLKFTSGLNLSGTVGLNMEFSATNHNAAFTNDLIAVNGNLTVSGPITVNMSWFGGAVSNGVYPLITYTGSYGGTASSDFGAIIPGSAALLVATNIIPASGSNVIAMIVAPPARPTTNLVWIGDAPNQFVGDAAGNTWSSLNTVSNWVAGGTTSNAFQSVDTVIFGDLSLLNSQNTNVTLSGVLYPSVVIVSNSAAPGGTPVYNLTAGSGATIAGGATLLKTNTGTLVLPSNLNYTGPTILGGGKVVLTSLALGGLASPIGASSAGSTNLVFNGGILYFGANGVSTDRGATVSTNGGTFDIVNGGALTFSGVFAGPGALSMSNSDLGNGQVTLSGANTYSGGTTNYSGTLNLGNAAAAGTGPITFNGGTVNITSGGTILNNINATTNGGLLTGSQIYQINGTIFSPTNGVLNIGVTGGGLAGSTNTVTFNSNFVASAGSVIRVKDNTTGFVRMLATSGTTNATINLGSGSVMLHTKTPANIIDIGGLMGGQASSLGGSRSATGATTWRIGANGSNTVFNGTISNNLDGANGTLGNPTVVNIIKVGTGTLSLTAPNYYTGTTTISNGVLQVSNNGEVDFQSLYAGIYPQTYTNAVIDSLLTNDQVFISGGTLAGNGTIWAPIVNRYGGNLQPGYSVSAPGTVLTVSNLTMLDGSTTTVKVQRSGPTADQVEVYGQLTYGGILTVNKSDSGYTTSDPPIPVFTFGVPGAWDGSSAFATIQPPPGAGLGWSLNQSAGTLSVVAASAVTAGFTGSPLSAFVGQTVTFVDTSANATYWVWTFGDGGTKLTGSIATNMLYSYSTPGTYTVTETAYGPGGSAVATHASYITVTQPAPVAVFTGGPTNIFVGGTVTLTDGSTDYGISPVTNIWNFGDTLWATNIVADTSVTHTYTSAGTYNVTLKVLDVSGNNTTNGLNTVTVNPPAQLGAVSATGGNIVFSGAVSGMTGQYRIWMTTDISQPLSSWTVVKTGTFGAGGSYGYTATTGAGSAFYVMSVP